MAKKSNAKSEIIGYRLDVKRDKWIGPSFTFGTRGEALAYQKKHYPGDLKFRVYAVRLPTDYGVEKDFYFKSLLGEQKEKNRATK